MSIETELLILKRLGFFRCLPDEQLRHVVFAADTMRLREGRELFRENQPGDCAFVMLGGQISLYKQAPAHPIVVRTVSAGEMIGKMALIAKIRRPVSAIAVKKSEVLRISQNIFKRALNEYPPSRKLLYRHLSTEFHAMIGKLGQFCRSRLE